VGFGVPQHVNSTEQRSDHRVHKNASGKARHGCLSIWRALCVACDDQVNGYEELRGATAIATTTANA